MNFLAKLGILLFIFDSLISAALAQEITKPNPWMAERRSPDLNVSAVYRPWVIVISGPVISEVAREAILNEAHRIFPFESIQEEMRIDTRGVDPQSGAYALAHLAKLDSGRVIIDSGILSLFGQVKSNEDVEALRLELTHTLPSNLTLATVQLKPPHVYDNYTWTIRRISNSIHVNGYVPSYFAKDAILSETKNQFPKYAIIDNSIIADGAPDNFLPAAKLALKQLRYASAFGSPYATSALARVSGSNYSMGVRTNLAEGASYETAAEAFKDAADSQLPGNFKSAAIKITPEEAIEDKSSVDLLFATDRARQDMDNLVDFGSERNNSITFGAVRVHVPDSNNHRIGHIELPSAGFTIFGFTFFKENADPKRHFIIKDTEILDFDTWKSQISNRGDEALIFVHGYNTSFQDSVFRLAQVVWDLQYKGPAILFSWPSKAEFLSYDWDLNSALYARSDFIELIKVLERRAGIKRVDVLAFSMGNFLVLDALSTYAQTGDPLSIGQLIMAAPDIDADGYKKDVSYFSRIVAGMTLYASANDAAIVLSRTLAQGRRAGDVVNGEPVVVAGVDAIDVSAIGSETLGLENHDVFATKRPLIDDIKLVLSGVRPPTKRLAEIRAVPDGALKPLFWRYAP